MHSDFHWDMKELSNSRDCKESLADVLHLATAAGHILLENGAEISRVEETMERIARHYGVTDCNFFVLSNGIFATGFSEDGKEEFANVEFIPIKGASLDRVVAVNALSRAIPYKGYTVSEAMSRLKEIRDMGSKSILEQLAGAAFGSAGFCAIFGGGLMDCAASFVAGILLWLFFIYPCSRMSNIIANILSSSFVTAVCILFFTLGFGHGLSHMIIGSIIPLIPGIPFTNGIRDLANGDYLAGATRLLDATIVFFSIAAGVSMTFLVYQHITGGMIIL